VFISGETGTGKELIARAVHTRSQRAGRAFVSVNCAALAPTLIASELFGHERGAFTGATQRRLGRFELADGGTIFLDEVGELLPETQVALLRVLQEREFERVGGTQTIRVDVRVITATNRDLGAAAANGSFRQDLFYRLNVFPIEVPPLRERQEDILTLVEYYVHRYATRMGKSIRSIDKKTLNLLQAYAWPGNIRELQNVIERSVILSSGEVFAVDESWLPPQSVRLRPPVAALTPARARPAASGTPSKPCSPSVEDVSAVRQGLRRSSGFHHPRLTIASRRCTSTKRNSSFAEAASITRFTSNNPIHQINQIHADPPVSPIASDSTSGFTCISGGLRLAFGLPLWGFESSRELAAKETVMTMLTSVLEATAIRPFQVRTPDTELAELRRRITATRFRRRKPSRTFRRACRSRRRRSSRATGPLNMTGAKSRRASMPCRTSSPRSMVSTSTYPRALEARRCLAHARLARLAGLDHRAAEDRRSPWSIPRRTAALRPMPSTW
jgi:hypothetical protein